MDLKDFKEWEDSVQDSIKMWQPLIVKDALKQGKYKKAVAYLKRNQPALYNSFDASPEQQFRITIRAMYDEAIRQVKDLAMKQDTGY